jgi:hypothetical protein
VRLLPASETRFEFVNSGWGEIPPKSEVKSELGCDFPGITGMESIVPGSVLLGSMGLIGRKGAVGTLQQETGDRAPAGPAPQIPGVASHVDPPVLTFEDFIR